MAKLNRNIRVRREELGMTQEGLGKKLGLTKYAIAKWESERSAPPARLMPRVAKALQTTVAELYGEAA